jgi:hypothetical protein
MHHIKKKNQKKLYKTDELTYLLQRETQNRLFEKYNNSETVTPVSKSFFRKQLKLICRKGIFFIMFECFVFFLSYFKNTTNKFIYI